MCPFGCSLDYGGGLDGGVGTYTVESMEGFEVGCAVFALVV